MKLNELLDVLADGTSVCLHDVRVPLRFETRFWSIDELRGKRCDEMTVMLVGALPSAMPNGSVSVFVELDWML